jgi:hypothetical protein
MHNAVVQILVYSGIAGTLIFVIFAALAGIQYVRNLLKLYGRGDYYLLASIFIFLVMLVSQMVSEAHILYSHADPFACVFWAYLGFGLSYAKAEKERLAEDHAFVCDTPLQVLNAVSMVLSDADGSAKNSDLFIYHQFKNSHEIAERVRKTGVFRNVYDFEPFPAKSGILSKITTFVRILNPRRALARRFQGGKRIYEKQDYGTLALSFFTPFSDVVHLALDAPRTIQFEDGTASYITENLVILEDNAIDVNLGTAEEYTAVTESVPNALNLSELPLFTAAGFSGDVYLGIIANTPRLSECVEYLTFLTE